MNSKQIFVIVVGTAIAAGVVFFGQVGGDPTPAPDDVIVAPSNLTGIAKQAKESADDYPVRAAANLREAKRRLESGEFTPNAARAWLADENAKARKAAYHDWHVTLDAAIASDKLPPALEESAVGFDVAGGKK